MSETAQDVPDSYTQTPYTSLAPHKFLTLTQGSHDFRSLPLTTDTNFKYILKVYMDDYIALAIATLQQQLNHVANATMYGIHDVFAPHFDDSNDPISLGPSEGHPRPDISRWRQSGWPPTNAMHYSQC